MPEDVIPYTAQPFISEFVYRDQGLNNFIEICNPGNQPIDLGQYMFVFTITGDPDEAIRLNANPEDYAYRYKKYIPGYKWQEEAEWMVQPGIAVQDYFNVFPVVEPGDVFVMTDIRRTTTSGYPWYASEEADIDFNNNPWGDIIDTRQSCVDQLASATFFMFSIDNDSVLAGQKAANDIRDFTLIETFGNGDTDWVIGGEPAPSRASYVRKPQFRSGKTGFGESFGTNADDSEWSRKTNLDYASEGVPYPASLLNVPIDIGRHNFDPVTVYLSTVSSLIYDCSEGYSMNEEILGVLTGTTVEEFMANIIKPDDGQVLSMESAAFGMILSGADALSDGDLLTVVSADGKNTTRYILDVTLEGLSDDAILSSSVYTIAVEGLTGTIEGFDYGVELETILGKCEHSRRCQPHRNR